MERDGLAPQLVEPFLADDVAGDYHHGGKQALARVYVAHPRARAQGPGGPSWPREGDGEGAALVVVIESVGQGSERCG